MLLPLVYQIQFLIQLLPSIQFNKFTIAVRGGTTIYIMKVKTQHEGSQREWERKQEEDT